MKPILAKLGPILLVTALTMGWTEVWSADWKEFAEATTGIFHYDVQSVTSPSKDSVRVWIHNATKYETSLIELNCKGKTYRVLDLTEYDETRRIKNRHNYYDNPNWLNIAPRSVLEPLHTLLCQ